MQFNEIAHICLWHGPQHLGLWDLSEFSSGLQERLEAWMCDFELLELGHCDDGDLGAAWLHLDEDGRDIAREVKAELGPQATVFYFSNVAGAYERINV